MNKKTLLTVDIKTSDLPEVKAFIEKTNVRIENQQKLLESYGRIMDGMISDAVDIKERLINVLDDLEVANTTVRLEEHDEALRDAIKSVSYLIDYLENIKGDEING